MRLSVHCNATVTTVNYNAAISQLLSIFVARVHCASVVYDRSRVYYTTRKRAFQVNIKRALSAHRVVRPIGRVHPCLAYVRQACPAAQHACTAAASE